MITHATGQLHDVTVTGFALAILAIAALLVVSGCQQMADSPTRTVAYDAITQPAPYGLQTGLPARATKTPATFQPTRTTLVVMTALSDPVVTSPFSFPTRQPTVSTSLAQDCTAVFPIESIEAIRFGQTTTTQLEAAFGHADSVSGRPTTYRFVARDCVLRVSIQGATAMEAELPAYGSLNWLLDRYGAPAAVGISEGNLVLLMPGQTVLLYPEQGVIATFNALPDDLTRAAAIAVFYARPTYEVERQIARLNLLVVDNWVPPLR